jgi:hypothetical protein
MVTVIDIMADTAVLMGITGAIAVTDFKGLRPLFLSHSSKERERNLRYSFDG